MTRVLVPLAILEGQTVSPGLIDLLGPVDVTVLGYHVLPEQTPPGQARMQYEERATAALADVTDEFRAAGGAADHRLVFTNDREQTVDRVVGDVGAAAVAHTGATGSVERVLVPLTGDVAVERILAFVADLVGGRDIEVTLFLAVEEIPQEGEPASEAQGALAAAAETLAERGVDARTELATGRPFEALVDAAVGYDAVIMGEQAPSLRSLLFGEEGQRVAAETVGPVLVVRRPAEADTKAETEADAETDTETETDAETDAETDSAE